MYTCMSYWVHIFFKCSIYVLYMYWACTSSYILYNICFQTMRYRSSWFREHFRCEELRACLSLCGSSCWPCSQWCTWYEFFINEASLYTNYITPKQVTTRRDKIRPFAAVFSLTDLNFCICVIASYRLKCCPRACVVSALPELHRQRSRVSPPVLAAHRAHTAGERSAHLRRHHHPCALLLLDSAHHQSALPDPSLLHTTHSTI